MCKMPVLWRQHYVTALIANQIFIVGRYQQELPFPESSSATVISQVKLPASVSLHMKAVTQECDSFATVIYIQPRPPYKIFQ